MGAEYEGAPDQDEAKLLMLISTPDGSRRPEGDLRREWHKARAKAAAQAREAATQAGEQFAQQIEAMWLRDMRKKGRRPGRRRGREQTATPLQGGPHPPALPHEGRHAQAVR